MCVQMAQVKGMETSNDPFLPPAMLAFESDKTSPYSLASELSEGLMIAKKGLSKEKFLKQYCQESIENDFENAISVLVGTQEAIHKWLRMLGNARCALWIEVDGSHEKIDSFLKLNLVYRQRDYRVSHVQVLQECKLVLLPTKQLKSRQNKAKNVFEDECEFDWNGLRKGESKKIGTRERSKGLGWWNGTTMRWYILTKIPTFKKLRNMLCPGGALWEFRRLLLQVINLPEFLDVDFQNINLQERLTHHPYAVFLFGRDAIMTRSTPKGIFIWKIVRFNFDQGVVTLAGGETLKGLIYCINETPPQRPFIQGIGEHQQTLNNKECHQNSFEHENSTCNCLDWAVWRGVYQAGPMETILTSAFASEDDNMVLKSLTTFFSAWKNKDFCQCCLACDLGTSFRECRGTSTQYFSWKLSSQERCAISHLQSVKKEVRRQGLRTLLNILLHEVRDFNACGLQKNSLNSARTPKKSTISTPLSSRSRLDVGNTPLYFQQFVDSKIGFSLEQKENVSLLSRLMEVMDRPLQNDFGKEKKFFGSETERALQAAEMKWKCFEEMKLDRSSSIGGKTTVKIQNTLTWQQVLEWVDNGFLEILLNEGMNYVMEEGKVGFILIEDVASACLQVVKILPGEGSCRIVKCLVSKLQNLINIFTTLKVAHPKQEGSSTEILSQCKLDKLRFTFDEMVRFCELLCLLVKSSIATASRLAELDGLFLILNLYSIIVKEFSIDVNSLDLWEHEVTTKTLPGEVYGIERWSSKSLKPHASIQEKAAWLERREAVTSKVKLPLQEVFEVSQPSMINPRNVSNVILDDSTQSSLQNINLLETFETKVSMTIDEDISCKGYNLCPSQMLKSLTEVIGDTKIYLLQSLATMLESQSITLKKCRAKMRSRLFVEATSSELLSLLLLDLIGGHFDAFPFQINRKLIKLIFNIVFLFENNLLDSASCNQGPQENQFKLQYIEDGPWWSGPGPPPKRTSQIQLLGFMLVELKKRMDHILGLLMITIPRHHLRDDKKLEDFKKMTKDYAETQVFSLWINLSYLFMVLSNYINYWPTKESKSQHILCCYGGHFHQTLALLARLGPTIAWNPAQILTIESLLDLLSLCIEDSISNEAKENWNEYENFLWEMLVDTWAHWNCIQSYISWMTLEVCQGCLLHQINDFQKSLFQPICLYYLALEEKLGMKTKFKDFLENFQYSKMIPVKAMMFLRFVVLLAQRKFYFDNSCHLDGSAYLSFQNNALWFLLEIMNPLHGLLIMTIKDRPLQICTSCNVETTTHNFVLEIYSRVEQYSLIVLAQIFNTSVLSSNAHVQENCSQHCANAYLSKKYLVPFLHMLYSGFKNLYTIMIKQTRLNSLCTLQETRSWEDENNFPLTNQSNLESIASNDKNSCSAMDEILNLCLLHVHVLHAIAKNFSKDGNQIFKDLCAMDFLIQEISLEYEFSQISGSRLDSKFEMPTTSTSSNLQKISSRKTPNVLKDLKESNLSSNSIGASFKLPILTQEYGFKNLASNSCDFMSQRSLEKCNANDDDSSLSSEQCKSDSNQETTTTNYISSKIKLMNIVPKNDSNHIIKNVPIHLSCNPIFRTINFGDRDDTKHIHDIECSKKEVGYSGRFFDLNEEVERELNAEDDDELRKREKRASIEETEFANIEKQLQSKNIENACLSPTSTRLISCRTTEKNVASTLKTHPWVPKLNFTSALKKVQSNLACAFDSEKIHNQLHEQFSNNQIKNVECKPSNLCASYENERLRRSIYHNSSLHILLLELIITLMLNPQGTLEFYYCDRFPMEHRKTNAPFYLFYHINHANNEYIVSILAKHLGAFQPSAYRILKLTWKALFDPSLYTNWIRIAQGALSQVYTANRRTLKDCVSNNELVVLKVNTTSNSEYPSFRFDGTNASQSKRQLLDGIINFQLYISVLPNLVVALPKGPHEPCTFFDVYSEVQILERFKDDARVCQILDYGVDSNAFVLVLKHYKCSLRAWTHCHIQAWNKTALPLHERLPLYLQVYSIVLQAVKALDMQNVVHYDLKCDNVLLEPITPTVSEEEFWQPRWLPLERMCVIPFRVSISDFGQSKASFAGGGECTARNRGTECVKSPEMLKLLSGGGQTEADRQRPVSTSSLEDEIAVGKAGDVWGLGCLLYELLTGEYLLYDEDWVRFFMRVTSPTEELIPDEKAAKLENNKAVIDFLHFILIRDPSRRPLLDDVILYLEKLQESLKIQSPSDPIKPQFHESTAPDIFDEMAFETEAVEEREPPNANACTLLPCADVYKRHQAARNFGERVSNKRTFKDQGFHAPQAMRQGKWWRWCACCWRKGDHWR